MGIPSYYKKLISTNPGLVKRSHPDEEIHWLFMDFNCLIYHCLHRPDTPVYPGDSEKDEWENTFIQCIVEYCLKVIRNVNPTNGIFIAIDGVVPMAKMRQQRLRRFKSSWMAKQPCEKEKSDAPKWDTNAITPGTLFMNKLRIGLENMIKKHGKNTWTLSSSDEPGEGEHKIIAEWRKGTYSGNFSIYGLDADLIVLSLLGYESCSLQNQIWLFREEIDKGKMVYQANGEEIFEWFSIIKLRNWLCNPYLTDNTLQHTFMLNYCFAMSVLGNDFLPTSLSFKIRDEAHSELLHILHQLMTQSLFIVDPVTTELSNNGLVYLFSSLAIHESERILSYILRKHSMARHMGNNDDHFYLQIGNDNWPLSHMEENILLDSTRSLYPDWKQLYLTRFFKGFQYNKKTIKHICKEYLYGIQWIWAYYMGQTDSVCFNWCYSFSLPPLWEWLSTESISLPSFPEKIHLKAHDILPVEQLALVLPLESWSLLPPCKEKQLPRIAPQFYPETFSFDSVGKRFFWECESLIPLPSILEIKHILSFLS